MPADKLSKFADEAKPSSTNSSLQHPLLGEAEISPQNREILLQIASLIRLAESFRLGFVKCNQPVQCRQMAARLKEMLAGDANIIYVELKEPIASLRRAVLQALVSDKSDYAGKRAIMVFGFEHSVPSQGPAPALDELNQSRDNFPDSFSGPVLIWLPDYALTRLAREAPDFWGWRSGVFELAPELGVIAAVEKMAIVDSFSDGLNLSEKMEKASALEGLIRDYQELPKGERTDRSLATVLQSLGNIRYQLGEYSEAHRLYLESLKISQDLGDRSGVSGSLHQLGMLAQHTGDLDEARRLYQDSLKISQELGDKNGVSRSLGQLGILAQETGELDEARRLYQDSLKIFQDLGDKNGVSSSFHQLGMLAQETGDLDKARRFYQESLKISQELGDKNGVSRSLHQLGNLAFATGDFTEARQLYQDSLKIFQDLGDRSGVSRSLHQLANLAYVTSDLDEARRLYQDSLKIKQELGDKSSIALTLAQLSLLEEKEGNFDKALELIRQAESAFMELGSPMAARAQAQRQRLEKKVG
ncbi:MAG: tetratricopeptide repeat protein [Methanothrix sp.]